MRKTHNRKQPIRYKVRSYHTEPSVINTTATTTYTTTMKTITTLIITLYTASAFIPPKAPPTHISTTTLYITNSEILPANPHPQEIRSFLTQRSIQSFMFLLASTRDLHTVRWLDNFTKPVIINNYWEGEEQDANPGVGDAFRENDKRYGLFGMVLCCCYWLLQMY